MSKERIASVLRQYRKSRELSVKEVAAHLSEQGLPVSVKTIYGWESGYSQPDADTLMILCRLYKIKDVLSAFGYSHEQSEPEIPFPLSPREKRLIEHYRERPNMQKAVDRILELEAPEE